MGMFNNFAISGSAMNAQSIRLNLIASNLANANSASSSVEGTYKARHALFQTVYQNNLNGVGGTSDGTEAAGVGVAGIVESQAPLRAEYRPSHPLANEEGYVYMPNVNTIEEMTDMIEASRSYQNNVQILDTTKNLLQKTINLGKS